MSSNKKPGTAFWTTVVAILALMLYVASFGPACRLYEDGYLEARSVWLAYRPLPWLFYRGPQPVSNAIGWWVRLFRSPERATSSSPPDPICIEWHVQHPGTL